MTWIVQNIHWILIVSGFLTFAVMLPMCFAPRWAVNLLFEEDLTAPSSLLIARSWGAMIAASGLMLIYAAWHPETRLPILLYSIVGKLGFIGLTVGNGRYARRPAMAAVIGDVLIVALLARYLLAQK
ncbi:MAG TPA: hypothetical protein VGH02_16835 [Rhizomicrobium sp.]